MDILVDLWGTDKNGQHDEWVLWPITNLRSFVVIKRHNNQGAVKACMAAGVWWGGTQASAIPMVVVAKIFDELLGLNNDYAEHLRRHICPICFHQVNYPPTTKTTIWSHTQTHCNGPKGIWCGSNGYNIYKSHRDNVLRKKPTYATHICFDQNLQLMSLLWPIMYKIHYNIESPEVIFGDILKAIRLVNLREGYWKKV